MLFIQDISVLEGFSSQTKRMCVFYFLHVLIDDSLVSFFAIVHLSTVYSHSYFTYTVPSP